MVDALLEALANLFTPLNLLLLLAGVLMGLFVSFMPGLGGVVGLTVLFPVVYGLEPASAVALMIGLLAVTNTSDTFPAVLIGVPGSSSGAATILDGHPLAKQGKAGFALGAAFTSSMFGGIIGAVALLAIIPIARPLVLSLGSPELFMLALLGLGTIGILSPGKSPLRGLLMVCLGAFLSTVGAAPANPEYRYTFDNIYLDDGIPLVILVIGLFAIPELIALIKGGAPIAGSITDVQSGRVQGAIEMFRHKWLVIRSSLAGVVLGAIPGIGGSATTWLVYAMTVRSYKDRSKFGKGDIRGVIGPEAANNSNDAGNLVPTLFFGIPGGASMAILLGGLIMVGVQPGPSLVTDHLSVLYTVVWTLALANILGTAICFVLSTPISRLTFIKPGRLVPFLFVALMVATFQTTWGWEDLLALIVLGAISWFIVKAGWPRPPLLIGFILGPIAERYLFISSSRFGPEFLLRPGVIALGVLFLAVIWFGFARRGKGANKKSILAAVRSDQD